MTREPAPGGGALRYHGDVDLNSENDSRTQLILLTEGDKDVLEIGPATGYITRILKERGCRVTAIEVDPEAAALAEQFCERMIVGDVEKLDFDATFGEQRFDVVMFGDVLEHLVDPLSALQKSSALLKPGGYVAASVPNIAHGSVRLALLEGDFRYRDVGLLDRTHLRFFTRESLTELFAAAGLALDRWVAIDRDPFDTEIPLVEGDFPRRLVDALRRDPDARTYQFVVKARPGAVTDAGARYDKKEPARALRDLEAELRTRNDELMQAHVAIHQITTSVGFRMLEKARRGVRRVAPWGTRRGGFFLALARAAHILMTEGFVALVRRLPQFRRWAPRLLEQPPPGAQGLPLNDQYELWLKTHALTPARVRVMRDEIDNWPHQPLVSVVMPVFNTEPELLRAAIESIRSQIYERWELCIADDASTRDETRSVLAELGTKDARVKVKHLSENLGIAGASNEALGSATGDFIGLLDHDDELKPDALFEVVKHINENPNVDYIYTDEDKKDATGRLIDPFFKPDWSPDLLMSLNYVTHFSVFRAEFMNKLDGFRLGFDGSQDYDLQLRATELTGEIAHIPKPLYTWRKAAGSAAASDEAKPYAYEAAKRALGEALERRGYRGEVLDGLVRGYYRVRYEINGEPKVSIIIPSKDRVDMLRRCVTSVEAKSSYRNYELLVVDNGSEDPATHAYYGSFPGRVISHAEPFNFSRMINVGAREAEGEYLLLLNNDTEVISPEWIEAMLEHAQRREVGVVGARLFYPDGSVQHEGVLVGPGEGLAGHLDHKGYFRLGDTIRNFSAVTAACMLVRRDVFEGLGGFPEELQVAYNDVDFCLRAREKGYLIVYTPYAQLYHYEGGTRGRVHPTKDEQVFRARWSNAGIYRDPYYNPNLDVRYPFTLRIDPDD